MSGNKICRILVSFDEKNYFLITTSYRQIITRNPTKDDLKGTKLKSYNKTNICHRCREENNITDKSILYPGNAAEEVNNGKKTGEWICKRHCTRDYHKRPDSEHNIVKSLRGQEVLKVTIF